MVKLPTGLYKALLRDAGWAMLPRVLNRMEAGLQFRLQGQSKDCVRVAATQGPSCLVQALFCCF